MNEQTFRMITGRYLLKKKKKKLSVTIYLFSRGIVHSLICKVIQILSHEKQNNVAQWGNFKQLQKIKKPFLPK